jgi:hypothetical protein
LRDAVKRARSTVEEDEGLAATVRWLSLKMASRAAQTLLRPALRLTAARIAPATPFVPRFAVPAFSSPSPLTSLQIRTKKTKAGKKGGKGGNKGREEEEDEEDEHVVVQVSRKGKGKHIVEEDLTDTQLPGEQFELKKLEKDMAEAIDRLRVSLKQIVGRVDTVKPCKFVSRSCRRS